VTRPSEIRPTVNAQTKNASPLDRRRTKTSFRSSGPQLDGDDRRIASADDFREWLAVCLDESIGRLEGPAVWHAWRAARDGDA